MTTLFYKALAVIIFIASVFTYGHHWGSTSNEARHIALQVKVKQQNAADFKAQVERGDAASTALQNKLTDLQTSYAQLDGAFYDYRKNGRILATCNTTRSRFNYPMAAAAAPPTGLAAIGATPPPINVPLADASGAGSNDSTLSAGAVWMWNSALAGRDSPAGACGLADQSDAACTIATTLTLADAWANQAHNAQLCAQDRIQHQHLIDFLQTEIKAQAKDATRAN